MSQILEDRGKKTINPQVLQLETIFRIMITKQPQSRLFYHLHRGVASLLRPATIYTATEECRIYAGFLFQPSTELRSLSLHFIRSRLMR